MLPEDHMVSISLLRNMLSPYVITTVIIHCFMMDTMTHLCLNVLNSVTREARWNPDEMSRCRTVYWCLVSEDRAGFGSSGKVEQSVTTGPSYMARPR